MNRPIRTALAALAVSTALTGCVVYDPGPGYYAPRYAAPAYAYPSYGAVVVDRGYYGRGYYRGRRFERP